MERVRCKIQEEWISILDSEMTKILREIQENVKERARGMEAADSLGVDSQEKHF